MQRMAVALTVQGWVALYWSASTSSWRATMLRIRGWVPARVRGSCQGITMSGKGRWHLSCAVRLNPKPSLSLTLALTLAPTLALTLALNLALTFTLALTLSRTFEGITRLHEAVGNDPLDSR